MHRQQKTLLLINVAGGLGVLGSYVYGFANHPEIRGALWGGVPAELQPFYTVSMLLAAVGYFPFTTFLVFRVDPDRIKIGGRFGFAWFLLLYGLILLPSALWMPLTFLVIQDWNAALWVAIQFVLILVAVGSLGTLAALLTLKPAQPMLFHRLAVAGAVAFCVQTALLDAAVWPAYFPTH